MEEEVYNHNTIIRDPSIEPFYITKDAYGYTINEDVPVKEGKTYQKQHGHFSNFGNVLLNIAANKINKKAEYDSIHEYLNEFKRIQKEIQKLTNIGF